MKTRTLQKSSALLGLFTVSVITQAVAATIDFSTAPAGNGGKPPVPNLILTLDNSNSMAGSGITALKNALQAAFQPDVVPTGSIRLGWNTINNPASLPCRNFSTTACGGNDIRHLTDSHRSNFLRWAKDSLNVGGNTPTHAGYLAALQKFDLPPTNIRSPWAEKPNELVGDYLSCRKSYIMLLTDGGYNDEYNTPITLNGSSNLDSIRRELPDGTVFDPQTNNALRIYRDSENSGYNTLADLAFHYWARDLVTTQGNDNEIKPTITESGTVRISSGNANFQMPEYWNPKNNPATWQHVVTHTIGFNAAASWSARNQRNYGSLTVPAFNARPRFPDDYEELITGEVAWPRLYLENSSARSDWDPQYNVASRKLTEMWHVAVNGRGNFYPAQTSQALVDAIKSIVQSVSQDTSQRVMSVAGSSLSARIDSYGYYTTYDAATWSGDLRVQAVQGLNSATAPTSPWGQNTAASLLNARTAASRNIITSHIGASGLTATPFLWDNLSADQKNHLNADNKGEARVLYLRGDRTQEQNTGSFRKRDSVLGDIVNSKVWFMSGKPNAGYVSSDYLAFGSDRQSRNNMLFVGANDGMLHAFQASNGNEAFAYVPQGVYHNLTSYSDPSYSHRYFVDGSPFTSDFKDGNNWKTALVGFMGAGSKGYFLIDVTNPTGVTAASVMADTTDTTDPDIGHIFQSPVTERDNAMVTRQIARLNNNEWALVTGNGYNSTDEKAVLLIHYLTGSRAGTIQKIYATNIVGEGNGLSAPRLIDLNGDYVPDVVYAGDLKGNLWKFDIASTNSTAWGLASTTPMLRARNAANQDQPITTAPVYTEHPDMDGVMVVVGTGQNLTDSDRQDTKTQSFYGILDTHFTLGGEGRGGVTITGAPAVLNRSELQEQVAQKRHESVEEINGTPVWSQTDNEVDYAQKKGWYLDMSFERERALNNPTWFDGSVLDLYGQIPASGSNSNTETCTPALSPETFITRMVDAATGGRPKQPPFGDPGGSSSSYPTVFEADGPMRPTNKPDGQKLNCVGDDCKDGPERKFQAEALVPPSWRQME